MEAIEFVRSYPNYLDELEKFVKINYIPAIKELQETDPHDLVRPDMFFINEIAAIGYAFRIFTSKVKEMKL